MAMSLIEPDLRIEHGVEEIDAEVDQHELRGEEEDLGLDHRIVAERYRVDEQPPKARPGKHGLDHDRTAEQETEFEPDQCHDRDEGVA